MPETIIRHRVYDDTGRMVASFEDEADAVRIAEILRDKGFVSEIKTETINLRGN